MGGWMGGWREVKAGLTIAYSNKKTDIIPKTTRYYSFSLWSLQLIRMEVKLYALVPYPKTKPIKQLYNLNSNKYP